MIKELLYQNKKIIYRIEGNGKPVLLIHGFGEDSSVWNKQVEFLKNKFQLIIPDLPGSGQSEMINNMSMKGMAEVIKAIIDNESSQVLGGDLEGANASIIGHSMGGYIMLAFIEKYPQYLNAFGLIHSSAYADTEEKKIARSKGIEFIKENGAFEFLKSTTPNLFSAKTKDERPEMIDEFIDSLNNFSAIALVSYYKAMMLRPDRTYTLKNSTVPVLFIMGEEDKAVPLQDGLQQCYLPEKSYIHILQHSAHMCMLEETEKTNQALENFLKEI